MFQTSRQIFLERLQQGEVLSFYHDIGDESTLYTMKEVDQQFVLDDLTSPHPFIFDNLDEMMAFVLQKIGFWQQQQFESYPASFLVEDCELEFV